MNANCKFAATIGASIAAILTPVLMAIMLAMYAQASDVAVLRSQVADLRATSRDTQADVKALSDDMRKWLAAQRPR